MSFICIRPSLPLLVVLLSFTAAILRSSETLATDSITELDKMVVSEKPDGVVPLMWCCVGKLTGRITIAPTVPPPTRINEHFKITVQYRPNNLKFRGPLFDTVVLEGTPTDYRFSNVARWKDASMLGFPPELCLPNGGQVIAIDGQDIWETSIYQLKGLWFNGRAGDPVTLVIQGADDDRFVFREITLKRISARKWKEYYQRQQSPAPADVSAAPSL